MMVRLDRMGGVPASSKSLLRHQGTSTGPPGSGGAGTCSGPCFGPTSRPPEPPTRPRAWFPVECFEYSHNSALRCSFPRSSVPRSSGPRNYVLRSSVPRNSVLHSCVLHSSVPHSSVPLSGGVAARLPAGAAGPAPPSLQSAALPRPHHPTLYSNRENYILTFKLSILCNFSTCKHQQQRLFRHMFNLTWVNLSLINC